MRARALARDVEKARAAAVGEEKGRRRANILVGVAVEVVVKMGKTAR